MAKLNTDKLDVYIKNKESNLIKLTDSQYEKLTGNRLPKDKYYLKCRSALSNWAAKNGYFIEDVVEKYVLIRKDEN